MEIIKRKKWGTKSGKTKDKTEKGTTEQWSEMITNLERLTGQRQDFQRELMFFLSDEIFSGKNGKEARPSRKSNFFFLLTFASI